MASIALGALCIFMNEDDKVDTYRFSARAWNEEVLPRSQSSLAANMSDFLPVDKTAEPAVALEYMDFMGCSGSKEAQICMAWQPNWVESWNGYGMSDGYPRFGSDELGVTAGVINARNADRIDFRGIML